MRAGTHGRSLGQLMLELSDAMSRLGGLRRLPPGYRWSSIAVPIIWATSSQAGAEVVRGRLGAFGVGTQAIDIMRQWWQAQGVQDEEAATRVLRERADTLPGAGRGMGGPRLPYDYLAGPLQEDVMEAAHAAGPM